MDKKIMNKKGITTLMMILEIIIILLASYSIFSLASKFASSETTNKIIIADDIKMMADTLVGTPGEAVVQYPGNVSKYTFILSSSSISVFIKGEGEQKKIVRYFSLPDGYQAFGTLEGKDTLCLTKEKKKIVLRECVKTVTVFVEETTPEAFTYGPTFYGIPVIEDRIVFVLDRSASMEVPSEWKFGASGEEVKSRLDVEKSQFKEVLKNLPDGKYFTVIMFNNEVKDENIFSLTLVELNAQSREEAFAYVDKWKPESSTNLYTPLEKALSYENIEAIFLITDGFPSEGITDHDGLVSKVVELNSNNVKINTIGTFTLVGGEGTFIYENEEKGKKLLQALADQNGGVFVMQEK